METTIETKLLVDFAVNMKSFRYPVASFKEAFIVISILSKVTLDSFFSDSISSTCSSVVEEDLSIAYLIDKEGNELDYDEWETTLELEGFVRFKDQSKTKELLKKFKLFLNNECGFNSINLDYFYRVSCIEDNSVKEIYIEEVK